MNIRVLHVLDHSLPYFSGYSFRSNSIFINQADHDIESIYITKHLDFMKKLFEEVTGGVIEIKVEGKKRLSKMMYAMYLGDFISCYIAILRKIDPTPVDAILELKNEIAKI